MTATAPKRKRRRVARSIRFDYQGEQFLWSIVKVERRQLYGSVSIETRSSDNSRCELATLAYDGRTVIPYGGTALGYMNPDGLWLQRDQLKPVDLDGAPMQEVESVFKTLNRLDQRVTAEEFLDHSVRLCYRLEKAEVNSDDDAELTTTVPEALRQELDDGSIYRIRFSYRGGVNADPAFLLANDAGYWLLVADSNLVEFTGLAQAAACARDSEPEEAGEDEEEIDFGML